MKRLLTAALALALAGWAAPALAAEGTLEKIARTGTLTIGTRRGSPPFGYVNQKNEWVGFSIDLVEQAIKPAIERKPGTVTAKDTDWDFRFPHAELRYVRLVIHEYKGVPVTPWNPGLGVAFAILVLKGAGYGLVMFLGVIIAEILVLRTELAWPVIAGMAALVSVSVMRAAPDWVVPANQRFQIPEMLNVPAST